MTEDTAENSTARTPARRLPAEGGNTRVKWAIPAQAAAFRPWLNR